MKHQRQLTSRGSTRDTLVHRLKRRYRQLAVITTAAAVATGGMLFGVSSASADVSGPIQLYRSSTGECLTADSPVLGSLPAFGSTQCFSESESVRFSFEGNFGGNGNYNGQFLIRNRASGLCMDGFGGAGNNVYMFTCDPNNPYQQWAEEKAPTGSLAVVLYRNLGNGLYLDNGTTNPTLRDINSPTSGSSLIWYRPFN